MHDMKRRAAAYLEFITRTQVELALDAVPWSQAGEPDDNGNNDGRRVNHSPDKATNSRGGGDTGDSRGEVDFKNLNSMEMMDVLTRRLVKWQNQFAD